MAEITGFSDRYIASLRAKDGKIQTDYLESNPTYRGLAIRVSKNGTKTWCFLYQWGGKRIRLSLGSYPEITVKEAHRRTIEARTCLKAHPPKDPREHMHAKSAAAMTVARLIEAYLEMSVRPRKLRTTSKIERVLRKQVAPVIGAIPLASLHRRDINSVVDTLMARGTTIAAARCHTIMHGLFAWAVARGDFEHNPMHKAKKPPENKPRTRVLTDDEIRILWSGAEDAIKDQGRVLARVLKFCLTTGCRIGEAIGLARAEIDFAANKWTLPSERSKNKHSHVLPLTPLALEIIGPNPPQFVFASTKTGKAFKTATVMSVLVGLHEKLGIPHFTSHDLRRTCANTMSATLRIDQVTIGHVLNHRSVTRATVTQRHYTPEPPLSQMRAALELWESRLRAIIGGEPIADVIPLRA